MDFLREGPREEGTLTAEGSWVSVYKPKPCILQVMGLESMMRYEVKGERR